MRYKKLLQSSLIVAALFNGPSLVKASIEPFIGEVQWFAGNLAPRGWAMCDGQLLPINSNKALFSILGTTYGGDGRTNFALPDVRGRVIIHEGIGPGLRAGGDSATQVTQTNNVLASPGRTRPYDSSGANMNASAITRTGSSQPHNNMQPYTTLNCIIAMQGTFPSRN